MSILAEVLQDLAKMFVADVRLTLAILGLIGLVSVLIALGLTPLTGGAILFAGSLGLLVAAVLSAARR
ncbi:MAG: hypothetical protein K8F59_01795 [Rhodobacteraceae bacterium]|nr:hypothetical protein [Paracoccaceae bacterium]